MARVWVTLEVESDGVALITISNPPINALAPPSISLEVGSDRVALITISNPPVNVLAPLIVAGLKEKYLEAMGRNDVKASVLTDRHFS